MDSLGGDIDAAAVPEVVRGGETNANTADISTSTLGSSDVGEETHASNQVDDKLSFRSSHASRQTVEDLEAKAQGGDKMMGKSLSRASSNSTETQPGAVAMYRSDSGSSNSSSEDAVSPSTEDLDTNCRPAAVATDTDEVPMIHAQFAADNSAPLTIQAQLAEDPPEVPITIPQAQLVTPPQEALHVQFDEEAPPPPDMAHQPPAIPHHEEPNKIRSFWAKHARPCMRFSLLLLVIGLIAGIVIPQIKEEKRSEDMEDRLEWLLGEVEDLQIALAAPTPAPSKQNAVDCFYSTLAIALAQAEDPTRRKFVICPNTVIPLGNLNDEQEIEGGDYPLTVLGGDVEISCYLDGRRENQCILEGGFVQVLLQPSLPDGLAGETVNRTDNVVFRGITFRGDLNATHNIGGVSVLADNPGQDISFVDCAWENMTAPRGVAQIGDSRDAMTFAPTTDVTFEDCSFSNIIYDGPLIGVYGQGVTLRRSLFEDLRLPSSIEPCQVQDSLEYCQGLLYCFERSVCELEDICVQGLEYAGPAAVATASHQTNLTVYGAKQSYGLNLHPSVLSTPSNTTCSTGMAQFEDPEYQNPDCLLESANWTMTDFCML